MISKSYYDWVQKADLKPGDDASTDHVALGETVNRINGQQFLRYAAFNPETNKFPHIWLFTMTTTALTQQFIREFPEK